MKLGLLKHMCIDFYKNTALKILYFSLIWHTDNICQNTILTSIKNILLRYLSYKSNVKRPHSVYI